MTPTAFKIFTSDQWDHFQVDGIFRGAPVDLADGYIHMSTTDQLAATLAKHFAGQEGLIIAEIDLAPLNTHVRWEVSRGDVLFPHLYADLSRSCVISVRFHPSVGPVPARLDMLRNVGKATSADFVLLNISSVAQLSACEPDALFDELQKRTGQRQDPCVHDVFAAAIHQARGGEAKNWWAFTAMRKARNGNRAI